MRRVALLLLVGLAGCAGKGDVAVQVGPPVERGVPLGASTSAQVRQGLRIYEQSGCAACHRLAGTGNDGPGPRLDRIGLRSTSAALRDVLVSPNAPMPSFEALQASDPQAFNALLAFLLTRR